MGAGGTGTVGKGGSPLPQQREDWQPGLKAKAEGFLSEARDESIMLRMGRR